MHIYEFLGKNVYIIQIQAGFDVDNCYSSKLLHYIRKTQYSRILDSTTILDIMQS